MMSKKLRVNIPEFFDSKNLAVRISSEAHSTGLCDVSKCDAEFTAN